jgi:terminase, large subunit
MNEDNLLRLERAAYKAFKPPEKLTLSEWADRYAFLSAESSAEGGRWHTLPYQKGIMDAITDPRVEQVTVMKSARVGYSKILNHTIAFHVHQDPCPIMLVQPTIEDAQGYSKEEIAPMLRDTPCLKGLVSESKAKDGANTILQKQFPGGTLSMVGANSPRGFRRVSRRVVLFDEVDGYPASAGAEGDQIKLGIRRTEYYWNRTIVAGSTPTVKDFSRVERMFLQTDQRRYLSRVLIAVICST